MTVTLAVTGLWALAAGLAGRLPLRDQRRRAAIALVVPGIPLLGWLTWHYGPISGLAALAAGAVLLRWQVARPRRRTVPTQAPAE